MPKTKSASTYQSAVDDATKRLYDGSDSPRIDAEVLLQHAINKSLAWLIAHGDSIASKQHLDEFYRLVEMRQQGQPIAYITQHKEFWSLDLMVNKSVLIPRADTEILVAQALERISTGAQINILDLGTGSGAIALSIAKERPQASVLATDSQRDALDLAKQNAQSHKFSNVTFLVSDWFSELGNQKFDLIAANPPYIEPEDRHLLQGDLRFEPITALVGAEDGLGDIRTIIKQAPKYLNEGGHLLIEHGYDQADAVHDLFSAAGFQSIVNYRDLNQLPRCSAAVFAA